MENSSSCFQRLLDRVLRDVKGCAVYIDGISYSKKWEEHMTLLHKVFKKFDDANVNVNLGKSNFGKDYVDSLGYKVGARKGTTIGCQGERHHEAPCPYKQKGSFKVSKDEWLLQEICKGPSRRSSTAGVHKQTVCPLTSLPLVPTKTRAKFLCWLFSEITRH